ncbi:hypothetical protein TUMEXPCC7403_00475 [Tumidithrix helvetica PCC 7403]|uniref:hypothetical protein n=1 Tax=Tumidithrix helvetica TaxID=3457545 RepID=UPI003CB55085
MNPLDIVFRILGDTDEFISKVNQACADKGLPPALPGNTDYRFEGFGVAFIGFKPYLTFWLHYKPDSPQHIAFDRFEIPISYAQSLHLVADLGHPANATG